MPRGGATLHHAYQGELPTAALSRVVDTLERGGLCILPTEMRYVLACSLERPKAVERFLSIPAIREAARYPRYGADADPQVPSITLLCHSLQQAARYVRIDDGAFAFIRRETPGASAFLLPIKNRFPHSLGRIRAVPLRIPAHAAPRAVAQGLDTPILASAVPCAAQEPEYGLDATLIHERWAHLVDAIVDDGISAQAPARWFDCTGSHPHEL